MKCIEGPSYVPFQPRTPELLALRTQLRAAISGLSPGPDEILYASLSGALPPGADVENALFYNLDAAGVFSAMSNGVSFEIDPDPRPFGVLYRYETAPPEPEFRRWQAGRLLADLSASLHARTPKLADVWWALRSASNGIEPRGRPQRGNEPFMVRLRLSGPAKGLTVGVLKPILDGTICALQSEPDSVNASLVATRLADSLEVSTSDVLGALLDETPSALGPRRRLVHRHGPSVKWEPDDDRCVAASVLFEASDEWALRGTVAAAVPHGNGA